MQKRGPHRRAPRHAKVLQLDDELAVFIFGIPIHQLH
jgi:hypothetical protein